MNSRQRVLAAVERRQVDRVPARFNAPPDDPAKHVAQALGIALEGDWFETLLQTLRIDVRIIDTQVKTGGYGGDYRNLTDAATADDVDRLWPAKWLVENRTLDHARGLVRQWDATGNPPAVQVRLPSLFVMVRRMRGDTLALMDLAEENDVFLRIMDRIEQSNAAMIDLAFDTLGERLDQVYLAEELGMQTGLMYSPVAIRKHFWPRFERLIRRVHGRGGKVFFHSCGAIEPVIGELIDIGVDILNPIQPYVPGMDPEDLAAGFGGRVCFCGGMDMQRLMPQGTPEEIGAEVRRYIRLLAPGYILDLANILHPDIPPANVLALYQAPR
jgi:uroporphyrinogen decarboxylase